MAHSNNDYDDDFELSHKNASIVQAIGTFFGLVIGLVTGAGIGVAIGGPFYILISMVIGLIIGPILGSMIAAPGTDSPRKREGEATRSSSNNGNPLKGESSHSLMSPLFTRGNEDNGVSTEMSEPVSAPPSAHQFNLRRLNATESDPVIEIPQQTQEFRG